MSVQLTPPVLEGARRYAIGALAIGLISGAGTAIGFRIDPGRAFHAYLTGYVFVLAAVLGCMAFVMIMHAANATWPVAVRRLPEAALVAMPALWLLFIPLLLGLRALYPWAHPEDYAAPVRHLLEHRRPFMNEAGFALRAFAYLGGWSVLALLLRRWSLAMDRGADPVQCTRKLRRLSYAGLPLAAFAAALSAYEWMMSLSPRFVSTMYSALWIAICLHAGVALIVLLLALARRRPDVPANPSHASALGRLLLAFLVFLGYTAFFQFLLIWMANRPFEVEWYLERSRGAYSWVPWFLIAGEFTLPFLALLSYRLKRDLRTLSPVALWCLLSLYIHVHWLITPSSAEPNFSWFDLLALLFVAGLTVSLALACQLGRPLTAAADPRYPDALRYVSR